MSGWTLKGMVYMALSDKPYIIAEMSANHAGSLENALKLVHIAKEIGADCLKTQTYTAETITMDCDNMYFQIQGGLWNGYTLHQLYTDAATPWEWQRLIKAECDSVGIDFLSTPFDETAVDFLEDIGVNHYKIASFELTHLPLLRYVAHKKKPVILSCGMGTHEEIAEAVDTLITGGLAREEITLLKCTSAYPATLDEMNLSTITDLSERFGVRVGLSDHSIGTLAAIVAVSLGACVVEKHLCLCRDDISPDAGFSSTPGEFAEMVQAIRSTVSALGKPTYGPTEAEQGSALHRRSIFATKNISAGEPFTSDNVRVIRPGHGLSPKYYDRLLSMNSKKDYRRGEPIDQLF